MLYAAYFCSCFSGLMVVGHLAGVGIDRGLVPMAAAGAVSVLAFSNAAVRVIIGGIVDKIGVKPCFLLLWSIQVVMLLLIYPVAGNATMLWIVALIFGWNYGAQFTLFPSATLAYYGATAQGSNYGLLFSAFGFAGLAGPWVGGYLYKMQGNYMIPFICASIVMAISLLLLFIAKPPALRN
jgi:MFS transporter, OFA family, oxalate/formate antiporter